MLALHFPIIFTAAFAPSFPSCTVAVDPGDQHPDRAEPKPQVPPRRQWCRADPAVSPSQPVVGQRSQGSWSPWPSDVVCGETQCSEHPCACPPLPSFGAQGLVGADWEALGRGLFGPASREGEEADVSSSETLRSSQKRQTSAPWHGPKTSLLPATLSN